MNNQYGTVNYEGKELTITQQPYIAGTHDEPVYRATAQDAEGNDYQVVWTEVNTEVEDEADGANWEVYEVTPQ